MTNINLARRMQQILPPPLFDIIRQVQQAATCEKLQLYLVGGLPRDLLLGKSSLDIDIAVTGDAIALGRQLADGSAARLTVHRRFGTANLKLPSISLDLTSTRRESYARPGALPTVEPSSIEEDLLRRDFSINAMAISLNPEDYGRLIDPCDGKADLKAGLIRVLHDQSFRDDATRIWRALRYEQRLGFSIEPHTLMLLRRDLPMLDGISGDRLRYELECVFKEALPEKSLTRASELGVLTKLQSQLQADAWLAQKFAAARQMSTASSTLEIIYATLLTYCLNNTDLDSLSNKLRLSKAIQMVLLDSRMIKSRLDKLTSPALKPSSIYRLLHGCAPVAIMVNLIASDSATAQHRLQFYLDTLRHVRPPLNGSDLLKQGVTPGPAMKSRLQAALFQRLDAEFILPS